MFGVSKTQAMTGLFEILKMFYLMGRVGRVGRVDGNEKCPLIFFKLCGHLELIYIHILVCEIKIVTNIPMGFKI